MNTHRIENNNKHMNLVAREKMAWQRITKNSCNIINIIIFPTPRWTYMLLGLLQQHFIE